MPQTPPETPPETPPDPHPGSHPGAHPAPVQRRGFVMVLSSPSGAGKTTLTRALLAADPTLSLSVSVTTRARRPQEVEGVHYHFIDQARFDRMVADGELAEYARVFGNSYGTPKAPIDAALAEGRDIVGDVDWQGTQTLAQSMRGDLVSVFVLPPSMAELRRRLNARNQDPAEIVEKRMAKAREEISHWIEYDYVLVNREVETSLESLRAIVAAERVRRTRQSGLTAFVRAISAG